MFYLFQTASTLNLRDTKQSTTEMQLHCYTICKIVHLYCYTIEKAIKAVSAQNSYHLIGIYLQKKISLSRQRFMSKILKLMVVLHHFKPSWPIYPLRLEFNRVSFNHHPERSSSSSSSNPDKASLKEVPYNKDFTNDKFVVHSFSETCHIEKTKVQGSVTFTSTTNKVELEERE